MEVYVPPNFVTSRGLQNIPSHRIKLANLPTPLQSWSFRAHGQDFHMLIKRDDMTDLAAHGNKLRLLEFILPTALKHGHDWILSFGPLHSNNCRVISSIAPRFGLNSSHVLFKSTAIIQEDGDSETLNAGNMFFHKLFGSKLFIISEEEYNQKGQKLCLEEAWNELINKYGAKNPYIVPMGGKTIHGVFGYIECFHELELQLESRNLAVDEIFFSCGSGGTAAGLAIGKALCESTTSKLRNVQLTGYIAWDSSPDFFHDFINDILSQLGLNEVRSENLIRFSPGMGVGYGINTEEETTLIQEVARSSGIILDGVYTCKALNAFIKLQRNGVEEGKQCLFLHTGGFFQMIGNLNQRFN